MKMLRLIDYEDIEVFSSAIHPANAESPGGQIFR